MRAEVNSKLPIAHAMDMGKPGFVSQTQTHEYSLADFKEAMECPSPITAIPSVPGTKLALALLDRLTRWKIVNLAAQPRQTRCRFAHLVDFGIFWSAKKVSS